MDPLARGNPPAVSTFDLSALECRFGTLKDKRKLSGPEKECLWRISVEMLNEAIDDGHGEAEAKVKLARSFDRYAVALAKTSWPSFGILSASTPSGCEQEASGIGEPR